MTYGESRRALSRVNVLRGYYGNEPYALTTTAPVNASNVDIKSGMVISLNSTGEWVKGCLTGVVPHIAYHDAFDPSTGLGDTDVASSGLLLGLSCAGDYEIETSQFRIADTYVGGTMLVAEGVGLAAPGSGLIRAGGVTSVYGSGTTGDETLDILGFVTRGKRQVQAGVITPLTGKFKSTDQMNAVQRNPYDPLKNVNSQATIGAQYTLTFVTRWMPKQLGDA